MNSQHDSSALKKKGLRLPKNATVLDLKTAFIAAVPSFSGLTVDGVRLLRPASVRALMTPEWRARGRPPF
jgi:hypothetical protein